MPREQGPSGRLKDWFAEQGVPEERAEILAWGAWLISYVDWLRSRKPLPFDVPNDFSDFFKSLDEELSEMEDAVSAEEADSAAQVVELTRQLKESRRILHDAERNVQQLQERLRSAEADAMRDRAELSQLRETLFELRAREGQPEDEPETEIEFPYQTERRIVAFGGHESWRKAIRPMLPDVRFFDREMLPDISIPSRARTSCGYSLTRFPTSSFTVSSTWRGRKTFRCATLDLPAPGSARSSLCCVNRLRRSELACCQVKIEKMFHKNSRAFSLSRILFFFGWSSTISRSFAKTGRRYCGMNINYDPLWDERGELRQGCTVREALTWLTGCGSHSVGETVSINGESYIIGRLLYGPDRPAIADKSISQVCDGYYRRLTFRV